MVQLDDPKLGELLEDDEPLPRMSFGDHLDELRKRVIKSLIAVVGAIILILPFKSYVQQIILGPYRKQWRIGFEDWIANLQGQSEAGTISKMSAEFLKFCLEHRSDIVAGTYEYPGLLQGQTGYSVPYSLYAINGLEDMLSFMWASLVFAMVIASPIVIWQIWAFIAAGLYQHERKVFYRYFPFMVVLIGSGVWFGYSVALPYSLGFLISMMDPSMVGAFFSVGQFLTLLFMTTAAMGVVFQVPLVMLALQKVGLVRHKAFRKNWRVTVLVIFVASALFSPPEPVSMILMSLPMLVLYILGLVLTKMGEKNEGPLPETETETASEPS